jgi:hypothetical protein
VQNAIANLLGSTENSLTAGRLPNAPFARKPNGVKIVPGRRDNYGANRRRHRGSRISFAAHTTSQVRQT